LSGFTGQLLFPPARQLAPSPFSIFGPVHLRPGVFIAGEVMARTKLLATLSIGIGLLTPLLVAEAVLRFLPVRSGLATLPVNKHNPVKRFSPNREFTFSKDWDFKLVNKGRTNNYGFVNDQDYDSTSRTPLLAVIGDSQVEAAMVPFPETLHSRLAKCMGNGRVYSFGVSGVPLSQYLVEASFARSKFRPDAFVVVIVGNDFDESLRDKAGPGSHYFRFDSSESVVQRTDYSPSLGRRLMRRSALVRYVILNLGGGLPKLRSLLVEGPRRVEPRHVGNTTASFTPERLRDSRKAVEAFLTTLPAYAGVDPGHILLILDAIRPEMYSQQGLRIAAGSFFDLMRRHLMERAKHHGYELVDMQQRFLQKYALDGSRFEYASDLHWSGRGHEEAAKAIASSHMFRQNFPGRCENLTREDKLVVRP
jgi:hypothetical protein